MIWCAFVAACDENQARNNMNFLCLRLGKEKIFPTQSPDQIIVPLVSNYSRSDWQKLYYKSKLIDDIIWSVTTRDGRKKGKQNSARRALALGERLSQLACNFHLFFLLKLTARSSDRFWWWMNSFRLSRLFNRNNVAMRKSKIWLRRGRKFKAQSTCEAIRSAPKTKA